MQNKGFCNVAMLFENTKVLEFLRYLCRSGIFDTKMDGCINNPEISSREKVGEQTPSGFSTSTISPFKDIENKHDVYKGKDGIKKFCESLIEHAMKIIDFKKKKIKLLTNEQQESYKNAKICYLCKGKREDKHAKDKKYHTNRNHCHYTGERSGVAHKLEYSIPKEINIIFQNGPNYYHHFIMKKLPKEFKGQFSCLGENTEKYITFPVPMEKEVKRIGKNEEETTKVISHRLQFIDSARFMASSLVNVVNNLAEGSYKIKCKYGHDSKKCETCEIKYKDCGFCRE